MAEEFLIKRKTLQEIADAIRYKKGERGPISPVDMPQKIREISGGIVPTGEITINENGQYDVSSVSIANVDVPIPDPPTETLEITLNGSYDVLNYAVVDVNLPTSLHWHIESDTLYIEGY